MRLSGLKWMTLDTRYWATSSISSAFALPSVGAERSFADQTPVLLTRSNECPPESKTLCCRPTRWLPSRVPPAQSLERGLISRAQRRCRVGQIQIAPADVKQVGVFTRGTFDRWATKTECDAKGTNRYGRESFRTDVRTAYGAVMEMGRTSAICAVTY